jgi:hypothetical protein
VQSQPGKFDPLTAVRNLCKQSNVSEGELLEYMSQQGITDGSAADLSQCKSQVLKIVNDRWAEVLPAIKTARAGGEREELL